MHCTIELSTPDNLRVDNSFELLRCLEISYRSKWPNFIPYTSLQGQHQGQGHIWVKSCPNPVNTRRESAWRRFVVLVWDTSGSRPANVRGKSWRWHDVASTSWSPDLKETQPWLGREKNLTQSDVITTYGWRLFMSLKNPFEFGTCAHVCASSLRRLDNIAR